MKTIDECKAVVSAAETAGLIWYIVDQEKHGIKVASFHGERTFSGHYFWQDAADYVLSLYPKEATPQPMTCRCKRFHWDADVSKWIDIKVAAYYLCATCPDCNTDCLPTGVVCYQEGAWLMLSTPYREDDLLGLKKQKEETVLSLEDAIGKCLADISIPGRNQIVVWGWDSQVVNAVAEAIRSREASNLYTSTTDVVGNPKDELLEAAAMVLYVSGTLEKIMINVHKNRYGETFTLHANPFLKESNMNQNDVEKAWPYKHLRHEISGDASYAGCFRILRDAKKDGVIENWWYAAKGIRGCPTAAVMLKGNTNPVRYDDNDGTKGDIGILREAADYVLGLRKAKEKPDPKTMSALECCREIAEAGYKISTGYYYYPGVCSTTLILQAPDGRFPINCIALTETPETFYRRCVEYIRGQKQ